MAGRAGRAQRPGEVWLQTHHPQHPLLQTLVNGGYHAFAASEMEQRQAAGFPPFAHLALLRAEPDLFGPVASDATTSRTIAALAGDIDKVEKAVTAAIGTARERVWQLAGDESPNHGTDQDKPLVIDVDATLVVAHSDKEHAAGTFKGSYGFHPLTAFIDHGSAGTGEPAAMLLRAGNAGSNTVTDHQTIIQSALKTIPGINPYRPGKKVLIRVDGAGGTKKLLTWIDTIGASYSVGFTLPANTPDLYKLIPQDAWTPAYNADGDLREGADVAELTGLLDLDGYPTGMRVIVRRERPHPGAQLRFDDVDGYRLTAFATNTTRGQLPDLELRHRRRARCEDRIRIAKDTGLNHFPFTKFAHNRVWLLIVQLANTLLTWLGLLGLTTQDARRWEPKTLRHRVFTIPATLVRRSRSKILHLKDSAPYAGVFLAAWRRLVDPAPA